MEEVGHWRLVLRILSGFFPSWWPQANSSALSHLSIMMHFLTTDPQTLDGNFLNCKSTMSFLIQNYFLSMRRARNALAMIYIDF